MLLVLRSGPTYAEWAAISFSESLSGYAVYLDPDTIRRKGSLVKMWELYDFKTIQTVADNSRLSFKMQDEYGCTEERIPRLAGRFFSGHMGSGKVVYSNAIKDKDNWGPVPPGSVSHNLWKLVCGKGQSSGRAPAAPPIDISAADLQSPGQRRCTVLAQKYFQGHGGVKDIVRAYMWFDLGALSGDGDSAKNRDIVARRMTPAQIVEAQRLSQKGQRSSSRAAE
jgi:hypothetical protein